MQHSPVLSPDSLPLGSSVTFRGSSFFSRNGHNAVLPSPLEVLEESAVQDPDFVTYAQRPPVHFPELGLLVKVGTPPKVTIAEGQCLWALRQVAPHVRVPEIYGWIQHEDSIFLYMELIIGSTLEERWDSLTQNEHSQIYEDLESMLSELHQLRQDPGDIFIGDLNRGPLGDVVFTNGVLPRAGPFPSVNEFHNWLSAMVKRGKEIHWPGLETDDIPDPWRQDLPDDAAIVFTHADLHPSNIMVSLESPCRVLAIIDWEQSGWYPDYWEFCKAEFAVDRRSGWATEYVSRLLEEPACVDVFASYSKAYGY